MYKIAIIINKIHRLYEVCMFISCSVVSLRKKKLKDNYTNNVFNAGADSKLGSYLNVRASV